LMLQLISIDDKKIAYHDIDQKAASWGFRFMPDGKSLAYIVREKGVDNIWVQPLDSSAYRPLTHFTSESIALFSFARDGSKLAIERGHFESDAVLLRDTSK
jgi:Tol biopolymer transport system component